MISRYPRLILKNEKRAVIFCLHKFDRRYLESGNIQEGIFGSLIALTYPEALNSKAEEVSAR
jgi:hypothetical protein